MASHSSHALTRNFPPSVFFYRNALLLTFAFFPLSLCLRRARGEEFPFPVTAHFIQEALNRLRFGVQDSRQPMDLWRGMADVSFPPEFLQDGGAELAPMSTTSDLQVALRYSLQGNSATLFCIKAETFLDRGADISWLSCFPAEAEFLYRPITSLFPRKDSGGNPKMHSFDFNGRSITVLEVEPKN